MPYFGRENTILDFNGEIKFLEDVEKGWPPRGKDGTPITEPPKPTMGGHQGMVTIYLSGGIANLSDEQMMGWRNEVKKHYGLRHNGYPTWLSTTPGRPEIRAIDPTRHDYRGMEIPLERALILTKQDKYDIMESDIVLAFAPHPSWGTAMEIIYAYEHDRWVVTVCEDDPSPWLLAHSDFLVETFEEAYQKIDTIIERM